MSDAHQFRNFVDLSPAADDRISREDQLVWTACRWSAGAGDPSALARLIDNGLDWTAVVRTAATNRVTPSLARYLLSTNRVPRPVMRWLIEELDDVGRSVRRTQQQFESVLPGILARQDVILLRGIAFGYTIYRGRTVRRIGDIDLLIERPLVPSLSGTLRDHYHVPSAIVQRCHAATIEYHYDLNRCWGPPVARIPIHELWARRQSVRVGACVASVLAPEDNFIYLCFHNVVKGLVKFYRFVDLLEVARAGDIDWHAVIERSRSWKVSRAVWLNCHVLNALSPGIVPPWVAVELRPGRRMQAVVDSLFNRTILLHDPNPAASDGRGSPFENRRKWLLARAVLATPSNVHSLLLAIAAGRLLSAYDALYTSAVLGRCLRAMRARLQAESMASSAATR
jgi:putative nucleotidyltransferase-like protein